ncbi:MAG: MMPL family transporter, partial [Bacteroidota bacterium]
MNLRQLNQFALGVIVVITGFFIYQLQFLQFDYEVEKFFPLHGEEIQVFKEFQSKFGNDNDYVFISIANPNGLFNEPFLSKLDELTKQLDDLDLVEQTFSLTNLRKAERDRFLNRVIERPWIHLNQPDRLKRDSINLQQSDLLGQFLSHDQKATLLYIVTKPKPTQNESAILASQLEQIVADYDFHQVHFAGKVFGQTTFIEIIEKEVVLFIGSAIVVILLFLWIAYRRFWGIWLPLSVVALTVIWTLGFLTLMGRKVDLVLNIMPTILLIIGIADVVHLLTFYLREVYLGVDKRIAIKKSIQEVGQATLLTTITTTFGFLSLLSSSFISLIELGIFATIGLFIAFLLTYVILPSVILLRDDVKLDIKAKSFWSDYLKKAYDWVASYPKAISLISVALLFLGVLGAIQIKINNYILTDLRYNHPQRVDFRHFADQYGGARNLECFITLKDTTRSIFEPSLIRELSLLENYFEAEYGASNILSPAGLIKKAYEVYDPTKADQLPESDSLIVQLANRLERYKGDLDIAQFITNDKKHARLRGDIPDWGSRIIKQKNVDFYQFVASQDKFEFHITGTPHLLDRNNELLAENVLIGLIIALVAIGLLFFFIYRSLSFVLIILFSNILPLLMIAGIMGLTGIDLKISTSIVFILALGIAVDDSIHFLS